MSGHRIGGFELFRPIGRGGMGVVYLARHVATGHPAAVKLMRDRGPAFARSFDAEVAAVASMDHPHVVRVLDHGRTDEAWNDVPADAPWIALELLRGGSARAVVGRLPWTGLRELLEHLLAALAHAHARDVLHRDVKPANLLRRTGAFGGWVLTDFGLAHGRGRDGLHAATVTYAAPEQLASGVQGPQTDLFAVGALAWALATGQPPFSNDSKMRRLDVFEPALVVPAEFESWMRTLCAPAPGDRFELAADALAGLRGLGDPETPTRVRSFEDAIAEAPTELTEERTEPDLSRPVTAGPPIAPWPRSWRRSRPVPSDVPLAGAGLGTFALRELPVVGREAEQDAFWEALEGVRRDGAAGLYLRGHAGVGVQRALRSFASHAMELGAARVVRMGAHRPLRHLARVALGTNDPEEALARMGVAPAARGLLPDALASGGLDLAWWRVLVEWGARRRPLVVEVETPSLRADLGAWLAESPRASVLLVAGGDAEAPDGWATLELPPLPTSDMQRFVESLLPLAPTAAAWLVDSVDGRPEEAVDIVQTWLLEGRLVAGPEGFDPGSPLERPVDGAARARWRAWSGRLTQREREVVEALAVLGHGVQVDLASAVAGRPAGPMIGRLAARGLVEDDGETVCVEASYADVVRASLDPERAMVLHRRAAEALEGVAGPGDVGWHRLQGGDAWAAVGPLLDAADAARIATRYPETLVRLDQAAEALSRSDPAEERVADRARYEWLRGWTLESQGHADVAAAALRRAVALAETAGDADVVVQACRARSGFLRRQGDREGAMRCVLAGQLWAEHPTRHGGALSLELALVQRTLHQPDAAREALEVALATIPHDDPLYGDALYFRTLSAIDANALDEALTYANQALGAYRRLGMMGGMGAVLDTMATVARRRGDLAQAEAHLRAAAGLHAGSVNRAAGLANLGLVRIARRHHAEAAEVLWEALERFRAVRFVRMETLAHAALVGPLAELGRWEAMGHHLERALAQVHDDLVDSDVADVVIAAAETLLRQERPEAIDALRLAEGLVDPRDHDRRGAIVALKVG